MAYIFRVFIFATFGFADVVVVVLDPPLVVTGLVFVVKAVVLAELVALPFDAVSVNPPASVSTHIAENSGCAPHEIPATL